MEKHEIFQGLLEVLMDDKMEVVLAMHATISNSESSLFLQLLVDLFFAERHELGLVSMCVEKETNSIDSVTTFFRGSGLPSTLVSACLKRRGMQYLQATLQSQLKKLCYSKDCLELDFNRIEEGADIEGRVLKMQRIVKGILDSIISSTENCPRFIREVLFVIRASLLERFPDLDTVPIISTFLCLRFFAAAIFDPLKYGVIKKVPTRSGRRTLVQVSKIVQKIANRSAFDASDHMRAFQGMADTYFVKLREFVENLLDLPAVPQPERIQEFDLIRSQLPLKKLLPVLQNNFIAMSDTLADDEAEPEAFEKLRTLLLCLELIEEREERNRQFEKRSSGGSIIEGIKRSRSMPKMDFDSIPDMLAPGKLFKHTSPEDKLKISRTSSDAEASVEEERGRGQERERERKKGFRGKSRERLRLRSKSKERKEATDVVANPLFGKTMSLSKIARPDPASPPHAQDPSTPLRASSNSKIGAGPWRSLNRSPEGEEVVMVNPIFGLSIGTTSFGRALELQDAADEHSIDGEVRYVNPLFGVEDERIPRRDGHVWIPTWRTTSWSHDVVSRFTSNPGRSSSTTHAVGGALQRLRKPTTGELMETIDCLQRENRQLRRTIRKLEKKRRKVRRLQDENKALRAQLAERTLRDE